MTLTRSVGILSQSHNSDSVYIFLIHNRITFLVRMFYTLNHYGSAVGAEAQLNICIYFYIYTIWDIDKLKVIIIVIKD